MAIDAHSTTAPADHRALLRTWAGAVPVPTPPLTAETVAMLDGLTPAPLPSLPDAFTRRRALFGAVVLAAAPVAALAPSPAAAVTKRFANDAALIARCDKLHGILAAQRELCRAYPGIDCDKTPGWDETEEGRAAILDEITETPAASLAGLAAKAEVLRTRDVSEDSMWSDAIGQSIADDVLRLHEGVHA